MAQLRTKICPYVCTENSRSVTGRNLSGISVSDGEVNVKLLPSGYQLGGVVSVKMVAAADIDEDQVYCYKSALHHIVWYREKYDSFPIIVNTLPNSCRIIGYEIKSYGTDESGDGKEILTADIVASDGNIDSEDGILQYDPGLELEHQQTQNQIVPGEDVILNTKLSPVGGGEVQRIWSGHIWWGTDYISGGKVISVNGEYGDTDLTYTVEIMNVHRTVVPSDFVEYAVGDWVFVMNTGSIGLNCEWVEREDGTWVSETGIEDDVADGWVIIPIKISNYGA